MRFACAVARARRDCRIRKVAGSSSAVPARENQAEGRTLALGGLELDAGIQKLAHALHDRQADTLTGMGVDGGLRGLRGQSRGRLGLGRWITRELRARLDLLRIRRGFPQGVRERRSVREMQARARILYAQHPLLTPGCARLLPENPHTALLGRFERVEHKVLHDALNLRGITCYGQRFRTLRPQKETAFGSQWSKRLAQILQNPCGIELRKLSLFVPRFQTCKAHEVREELMQ